MTNGQSKFIKVLTPCKDYVHPWTESCWKSTAGLLLQAFQNSLQIYTAVYSLSLLTKGRLPTKRDIYRTFYGILQSSAFLATNSFSYVMFTCLLRNLFGCYYYLTVSYIPAFLASFCAILIERPARRTLLTLYVANVATETLWRMGASRNIVSPISQGQIIIFGISLSILLYLFRLGLHKDYPDSIFNVLRVIIGAEEEGEIVVNKNQIEYNEIIRHENAYNSTVPFSDRILSMLSQPRRACRICPHNDSCFKYSFKSGLKLFIMGTGLQLTLKIVMQFKKIIKMQLEPSTILCDSLRLGMFLGGFTFSFKFLSCFLRNLFGCDNPKFAIVAGLVGSCAFLQYRDNTVVLYVMWKTLQLCYNIGTDYGIFPRIHGFQIVLYCASTALLFHAAILEPTNLRSSYWKFLYSISGGRVAAMNRESFDVWAKNSYNALQEILRLTNTNAGNVKYAFN